MSCTYLCSVSNGIRNNFEILTLIIASGAEVIKSIFELNRADRQALK